VTALLGLSDTEVKRLSLSAKDDDRRNLPGFVRISFGMYNTKAEADKLTNALEHITAGSFEGKYQQNKKSGEYTVTNWQPTLPKFF